MRKNLLDDKLLVLYDVIFLKTVEHIVYPYHEKDLIGRYVDDTVEALQHTEAGITGYSLIDDLHTRKKLMQFKPFGQAVADE